MTALLILLVAKALGYAVSLGCGFRGGLVFPAIFLGVGVTTTVGLLTGTSPTVAVAVGAGTSRPPHGRA